MLNWAEIAVPNNLDDVFIANSRGFIPTFSVAVAQSAGVTKGWAKSFTMSNRNFLDVISNGLPEMTVAITIKGTTLNYALRERDNGSITVLNNGSINVGGGISGSDTLAIPVREFAS